MSRVCRPVGKPIGISKMCFANSCESMLSNLSSDIHLSSATWDNKSARMGINVLLIFVVLCTQCPGPGHRTVLESWGSNAASSISSQSQSTSKWWSVRPPGGTGLRWGLSSCLRPWACTRRAPWGVPRSHSITVSILFPDRAAGKPVCLHTTQSSLASL